MSTYQPGWYEDPEGLLRYHNGEMWTEHVRTKPEVLQGPEGFAKQVATYEKTSGWLWIALGVLQVLMIYTAIAGAWNIYAGYTRIKASPAIAARDYRVPQAFQSVTQYIVLAVINAVLGAWIGVLILALDLWIRSKVLKNADMFDQIQQVPEKGYQRSYRPESPRIIDRHP